MIKEIALTGLIFFMGCAHTQIKTSLKKDTQIGNLHLKDKKIPIRQIKVFNKGDCIIKKNLDTCLLAVEKDICEFYLDKNNNGKYDMGIDALRDKVGFCRDSKDPMMKMYPHKNPMPKKDYL